MGRGRQKAKQQKIARKLKYLTTDTDYDELAKELGAQEPGTGSFDPFVEGDELDAHEELEVEQPAEIGDVPDDDLDEYARWAAEAAAKATSGEMPAASPVHHKPIPMPVPDTLKHHSDKKSE